MASCSGNKSNTHYIINIIAYVKGHISHLIYVIYMSVYSVCSYAEGKLCRKMNGIVLFCLLTAVTKAWRCSLLQQHYNNSEVVFHIASMIIDTMWFHYFHRQYDAFPYYSLLLTYNVLQCKYENCCVVTVRASNHYLNINYW